MAARCGRGVGLRTPRRRVRCDLRAARGRAVARAGDARARASPVAGRWGDVGGARRRAQRLRVFQFSSFTHLGWTRNCSFPLWGKAGMGAARRNRPPHAGPHPQPSPSGGGSKKGAPPAGEGVKSKNSHALSPRLPPGDDDRSFIQLLARQIAVSLSSMRRIQHEPKPVLIALCSYGGPANAVRALLAGFDHHVVKPGNSQAMLRLIDSAMRPE